LLAPAVGLAQDTAVASAETTLVTTRPLKARTLLRAGDIKRGPDRVNGALADPGAVIGMETRGWLSAGQPIMPENLAPAALVERNEVVSMRFLHGMLQITAEGRALDRAARGERIRVMNLDSRTTVTATVIGDGLVEVR
jgi:flagella basal body P-ring formation protein FlgA